MRHGRAILIIPFVDVQDGNTALMLSIIRRNDAAADILIGKGAGLHAVNKVEMF